jgi:hypothetical protein
MNLFVPNQTFLVHLETQNQSKYYQHQNYVKKNTKTIKIIRKPITKPSKSYVNQCQNQQNHNKTNTKTTKTIENQNSRLKFQNRYWIWYIFSLHGFLLIS